MSKTHREEAYAELKIRFNAMDIVLIPQDLDFGTVQFSRSDLCGSFELTKYGDVSTWEIVMRPGDAISGSGEGVRSLCINLKEIPYTPVLRVWKITQNVVNGYDSYDSAVVIAMSAEKARATHPFEMYYDVYTENEPWTVGSGSWPDTPGKVEVELIGIASPGAKPGVVCASFNAG